MFSNVQKIYKKDKKYLKFIGCFYYIEWSRVMFKFNV